MTSVEWPAQVPTFADMTEEAAPHRGAASSLCATLRLAFADRSPLCGQHRVGRILRVETYQRFVVRDIRQVNLKRELRQRLGDGLGYCSAFTHSGKVSPWTDKSDWLWRAA